MTIDIRNVSPTANTAVSMQHSREERAATPTQPTTSGSNGVSDSNQVSDASLALEQTFAKLGRESDVNMELVNSIQAQLNAGTLDLDTQNLANQIIQSL